MIGLVLAPVVYFICFTRLSRAAAFRIEGMNFGIRNLSLI